MRLPHLFMKRQFLLLVTLATVALLIRCTDPTVIGGELLDGNQLPVQFTDTFAVEFNAELSDTSQVVNFSVASGSFAVGCLDDPLLGTVRASVGFELLERDSSLSILGVTIDSAVLVLPLDISSQVGDTTAVVELQVSQAEIGTATLPEALTSDPLESTGTVYGNYVGVPSRRETTVNFFTPDSVRVDTVAPQLRIPLNQQFITDLQPALNQGAAIDSTNAYKDSLFAQAFGGLIIEPLNCSGTLPAVSVTNANAGRFGVYLYFTRGGRQFQYTLSFFRGGANAFNFRPTYQHDYAGSFGASLLTGSADADSVSVIESLDGLATRVSFPDLNLLNNKAVNFAQLEVPILRDGFSEPLARVTPVRRNAVGDYVAIGASRADNNQPFAASEGGTVETVAAPAGSTPDSIEIYRFNLTSYFQLLAEGVVDSDLYLIPVGRVQLPGRSLLAGPDNDSGVSTRLVLATTTLP